MLSICYHYHHGRRWAWLLTLLLLLPFSGCQSPSTDAAFVIQPLAAPPILRPDHSYTFRFVISDRSTEQPQAAIAVEALLTFDDGTILQLFSGQTDDQGQVTFAYQTPYRQPASKAKLTLQAQDATGLGAFQTTVELLPSLIILPRQLPAQVAPGSQAPIALQIYDQIHSARVAGVPVQARLTFGDGEVREIFQGESNAAGAVDFMLTLPTDLRLQPVRLDVYAQAEVGEAHLQRKVTVVAPVTVTPLTAPQSIFAGSQVTYAVRIDDNVNHEPAAYSDVQVYLSGGDYSGSAPIIDEQADGDGVIRFTFTAPNVSYPTSLYLNLHAQGFEGNTTYSKSIQVIPTLALSLIGLAERVTPGSSSELQVRVWDNQQAAPARDAAVTVELQDSNGAFEQRHQGTTDATGIFTFRLEPPADLPEAWLNLTVNATTPQAAGTASYGVVVQTGYHLLMTTDKPLYQPGQTIHLRLLALDSLSNRPVSAQSAQLTVRDPRGNTLVERKVTTSGYGVATTDVELDTQASSGAYQISVSMGSSYNSHDVEVKPYSLPHFQIAITDTHPYYAPGATAAGMVEARYFFGKPVADGQVVIRGYGPPALNSQQEELLFTVSGRTDAVGRYGYQLPLPATFRDQLRNKSSKIRLEVDVIDGADHLEQSDATLTLAEQPLLLEAVPEAGHLKPGLANLVYVQVKQPNGSAIQTAFDVAFGDATATWQRVTTDAFGLATLVVTPTQSVDLPLFVRYGDGSTAYQATIPLPVQKQKTPAILLRPSAAEVAAGGELALDLWVASAQSLAPTTHAYVELIKAGQVIQMVAVPLQAGHGHITLPLDPQLVGTVLVNAHLLLAGDQRSSDARLVLVNPAPVDVAVTADATSYRPGDTAYVTITATHQAQSQPGIVGVTIVDESVFALDEQTVGFARTFFLLDRELREARYGISGFADFGDALSPYDSYGSYANARYPSIEPTLVEQRPGDAATIKQARTTALLAWMAQDLQMTEAETPLATAGAPQNTADRSRPHGALMVLLVIGVVAYPLRRKGIPPLVALFIVGLSSCLWVACAASVPAAPSAPPAPARQADGATAQSSTPRLRQFFPETLLWLPEQATDAQGRTTIAVPLADSITTWRVSVLFSDQAGNLGSAETDLRVFQDFFIEPQLPVQLTQGDAVQAPFSIYNYLDHPQAITVSVQPAAWFSSTQPLSTTVTLAANEVAVTYFPLRVTGVGEALFTVNATGDQSGDRVERAVHLVYNGETQTNITSGRLTGSLSLPLTLPAAAITGTRQVTLRLYPSTLSQLRQGIDGLVQRPNGNAADLAAQNFANGLLLSLAQQADPLVADPLRQRAERLIQQGYQRLLAYESELEPGGFSFYGDPPARPWLSAYVLWQLAAMSKVTYVDPQLPSRITSYLYQQQLPDGSWPADEMRYYGPWQPRQARLATTAYIAWLMAESGNPNRAALAYLRQAEPTALTDPYVQALVSNALLTDGETHPQGVALLEQLAAQHVGDQGLAYWTTTLTTFVGGAGESADQETTALIAYALLRSGQDADLAQSALDYLLSRRGADGTFATPQLTVLTLQALLLAASQEQPQQSATVTVAVDGQPTQQLTLDAAVAERQEITLTALPPTATIEVAVDGEIVAPYQLISTYVLPWEQVAAHSADALAQPFVISTAYDQENTLRHALVTMRTTITMSVSAPNEWQPGLLVATLGLPPGFTPLPADLTALGQMRTVSAYALGQNQLLLYLNRLHPGRSYVFTLRLQANTPGSFQVQSTQLAELYGVERRSVAPPQRLAVMVP